MSPSEPLVTPEELQCLLGWALPVAPQETAREAPRPAGESLPLPVARPWASAAALAA